MNQQNQKKRTLLGKITLICVIFGLITIIVMGLVLGYIYRNDRLGNYDYKATTLCQAAVDYIDPVKLEEYIETREKDEYYELVQKHLENVYKYCNITYYYVCVPQEEGLMYIWDTNEENLPMEIGWMEDYLEGDKEDYMEFMSDRDFTGTFEFYEDDYYGRFACAYVPIKNADGDTIALVAAEFAMPDITGEIFSFVREIVVGVIAATLLVLIPYYFVVRKQIIVPVNEVSESARFMVDHLDDEKDISIDVSTGDELEEMAKAFMSMNIEVKQYVREFASMTSEKERIGAELDIATRIQNDMLPKNFINTPNVEVYASMNPAKEVGGDFYDFFMVDNNHLAIVIADVSGKGVPAALFMAISKTVIRDRNFMEKDLGSVFSGVNNILCNGNEQGMFVTAFEGVLDLRTGQFDYVNAGHEPPFIMKQNGEFEKFAIKPSIVLGMMPDMVYTSGSITLEPGDRLFEYTDGVTEATNIKNEMFEFENLKKTLNAHKDEQPRKLLRSVKSDIDNFVGEAPQFDDLTMICLDFKSKMS